MTDWLIGGYGPDMGGTATGMLWGRSHPDGRFEVGPLAAELDSPSWITVDGRRVFAALEGAGAIVELTLERGRLEPEAHHEVGQYPCHIAVAGGMPMVACYGDGVIWTPSGALTSDAPHGPLPAQDGPHAHHVLPLGSAVLTLDLGTDRLYVHHVVDGMLHRVDEVPLPPGTGPRDLLPLPDGRVALLGEWSCELIRLEPMGDTFEIVQIEPRPDAVPGTDQAAGLGLVGRFIVAGIRGSNLLATLELGDAVAPVASVGSGGDWPRHLVVDGEFVHVANQLSNAIATFRIGPDGIPTPVGEPVAAPSPTCLAAVSGAPEF
jgi:6-phosphogluconolactonase (cycloisomerase 2 family)